MIPGNLDKAFSYRYLTTDENSSPDTADLHLLLAENGSCKEFPVFDDQASSSGLYEYFTTKANITERGTIYTVLMMRAHNHRKRRS